MNAADAVRIREDLGLDPLYHNLGGPRGVVGCSIGSNPRGGYVFLRGDGMYLLCIVSWSVKASTPATYVPRFGSYLICELGRALEEVRDELDYLRVEDVRAMAESSVGPWQTWQ